MKEPCLKPLDSALCISREQKSKLAALRHAAGVPIRKYWKHGLPFWIREDDPEFERKMRESEKLDEVASRLGRVEI